jgi:hypothetical protein
MSKSKYLKGTYKAEKNARQLFGSQNNAARIDITFGEYAQSFFL